MSYKNLKFMAFLSSLASPMHITLRKEGGPEAQVDHRTLTRFISQLGEASKDTLRLRIGDAEFSAQEVLGGIQAPETEEESALSLDQIVALSPLGPLKAKLKAVSEDGQLLPWVEKLSPEELQKEENRILRELAECAQKKLRELFPAETPERVDRLKEYKDKPDDFVEKLKEKEPLLLLEIAILLRHHVEKGSWEELTQFCINLMRKIPETKDVKEEEGGAAEVEDLSELEKKQAEYDNATVLMLLLLVLHNKSTDPKNKEEIIQVIRKVLQEHKTREIEPLELYKFLYENLEQLHDIFVLIFNAITIEDLNTTHAPISGNTWPVMSTHVSQYILELFMRALPTPIYQTILKNDHNIPLVSFLITLWPYLTDADPNTCPSGEAVQQTLVELKKCFYSRMQQLEQHCAEPVRETITDTWKLWAFIAIVFVCFILLILTTVGPFAPVLELEETIPLMI